MITDITQTPLSVGDMVITPDGFISHDLHRWRTYCIEGITNQGSLVLRHAGSIIKIAPNQVFRPDDNAQQQIKSKQYGFYIPKTGVSEGDLVLVSFDQSLFEIGRIVEFDQALGKQVVFVRVSGQQVLCKYLGEVITLNTEQILGLANGRLAGRHTFS
jgi:hypothetical protein